LSNLDGLPCGPFDLDKLFSHINHQGPVFPVLFQTDPSQFKESLQLYFFLFIDFSFLFQNFRIQKFHESFPFKQVSYIIGETLAQSCILELEGLLPDMRNRRTKPKL
ncbi:hypothetical protein PanWU01x14_371600, partial [Parasponia andersonii]